MNSYLYDISMKCKIYMRKESFRGSGTSLLPYQNVMKSSVVIVGIYEGCQKSSWTPSLQLNRNND